MQGFSTKSKHFKLGGFRGGAPDRIRTCDLCLRRAALYPAELRAHRRCLISRIPLRRETPSRPNLHIDRVRSGLGGLTSARRCPTAQPSRLKRSALRGFCSLWLAALRLYSGFWPAARSAAADELVNFTSAGQGDPIQGYLTQAEGSRPFPGRRPSAHLPRPAGRARFDRRADRDLGLCRPVRRRLCNARPQGDLRRRLQQALPDADGALAYLGPSSLRRPTPDRGGRVFARGRHGAQDRTPAARPASRRRRLSTLRAPTWRARRSTSRRSSSSARRTR